MEKYKLRFPGIRWHLVYGNYAGIEEFAVNELQRLVQHYQPYVIRVQAAAAYRPDAEANLLLVGTPRNNRWIHDLARRKQIALSAAPESYTLAVLPAPWKPIQRVAVIAGATPKGVLNGVVDFGAKVVARHCASYDDQGLQDAFNALPDLAFQGAPALENRGIWTWGYVIHDYRGFLDNMARLKMNMLVMWNDWPPVNARQIVAYAHRRGIRLICGFHWGWGVEGIALSNRADCDRVRDLVLDNYEKNYRPLGIDGIYFQTITEHTDTAKGGRSTAALACDWVNRIGRALLRKYPDLYIQFGLHATSIVRHYRDLQPLDPRIAILWEDAGVMPYTYVPQTTLAPDSHLGRHGLGDLEGTLGYSKKLAAFRPKSEFGLCPKGFANLSWGHQFEHHGPFLLGEKSAHYLRRRYDEKKMWMDRADQLYLRHAPCVARFYRDVRAAAPRAMTSVALVEDALFEVAIPPSVALHAEITWNPHQPDDDLRAVAMSPYYKGI